MHKGRHSLVVKLSFSDIVIIITVLVIIIAFGYEFFVNSKENVDPRIVENVCSRVDVQFSRKDNLFCFTVETNKLNEYPSIPIFMLFGATATSPTVSVKYNSTAFIMNQGEYPNAYFCIDHQFPGEFELNLFCNFEKTFSEVVLVDHVDFSNNKISHVSTDQEDMLVLTDFCVNSHDDVMFISNGEITMKPFQLSVGRQFNFWVVAPETKTKKWQIEDYTTIFPTTGSSEPWLSILSSLLPLWQVNFVKNTGVKLRRIFVNEEDAPTFRRLVNDEFVLYKDRCFQMGVFPKAGNSRENSYFAYLFELITKMPPVAIQTFKSKMTTTKPIKNKIVIDRQFAKDCSDLFNLLRGFDIKILNEKRPVHEIADEIHSASYFVSSHLTTSVYAVFLDKDATLIERRIIDAGCIDYASQIASLSGCKYIEIGHEDICNVGGFHEYFSMPLIYPNVNYAAEVTKILVP